MIVIPVPICTNMDLKNNFYLKLRYRFYMETELNLPYITIAINEIKVHKNIRVFYCVRKFPVYLFLVNLSINLKIKIEIALAIFVLAAHSGKK